jgi:hypothetical protein
MVGLKAALSESEQQTGLAHAWIAQSVLESPIMMNLNMKS